MKARALAVDPQDERRRRTILLAWAHALLALAFVAAFVWVQGHR